MKINAIACAAAAMLTIGSHSVAQENLPGLNAAETKRLLCHTGCMRGYKACLNELDFIEIWVSGYEDGRFTKTEPRLTRGALRCQDQLAQCTAQC